MRELLMKGREYETLDEIYEFLRQQLEFPENGQGNRNVLYDCLTKIGEDTRIIIDWEQVSDETILDEMEQIAEVMQEAQEENGYLEILMRNES